MLNLPSLLRRSLSANAASSSSIDSIRAIEENVVNDRAQTLNDIKRSVHRYLASKLDGAKYQLAPQFFAAIVAGGLATNAMHLPSLARPVVHAYVAAIAFAVTAKMGEFALGKITFEHFMDGLKEAIQHVRQDFQQETQLAIRDEALERGVHLSVDEIRQMYKELVPELTATQLAGSIAVGGTVFLALGYTSLALGASAASLGLTGVQAAAAQATAAMLPNLAGGALLVAFNQRLVDLPLPPGSALVTGGTLALSGLIGIANAALPAGTPESVKMLLTATVTSLISVLLLRFKDALVAGVQRPLRALTTFSSPPAHQELAMIPLPETMLRREALNRAFNREGEYHL